jgi:6,7-dimethyl-8-ribityllumazine synthase
MILALPPTLPHSHIPALSVPESIEGHLDAEDDRFGIALSRFNETIGERLLAGALDALRRHGADVENDVTVARCPGAMELPLVAKTLAASGDYDAVLCLGAVIRGATSHYDLVTAEAAGGAERAALDTDVPVLFGVVTTDTIEQAVERSGTKAGNKGFDAAVAAIEMADLMRRLEGGE